MDTEIREKRMEKGEGRNETEGRLPVISFKRAGGEAVRVEFDSANGWLNLYGQKSVEISRSGSRLSFELAITMPPNLWALVIARADGIIGTNNLIPAGFDGLFRFDLRLIDDETSARSLQPETLLISIIPFARIDFAIRDGSPKPGKSFEELVEACGKGAPFARARAMGELMEGFPNRGRSYLKDRVLDCIKNPRDFSWGDFGEAFHRVAFTYFKDRESVPLLIKIMDTFGTSVKEKFAPLLASHNTEEVAQALVRAYQATPFWGSSATDGREELLDWDYENSIVQAICRLDNPVIIESLHTALLRGSRAREKALEALVRLADKKEIVSYFEPYLNKEHNWWELTDMAANARWVFENL